MTNRREFLAALAAILGTPALARAATTHAPAASVRLAAAWRADHGYQVGVLSLAAAGDSGVKVAAALDVPTRAHGLLREPGGTLLAVARRPGDWLLRWDNAGRALAWHWIEPRRAFAGHVLASADGRTLFTTEMDLDSGTGLLGVRDAATLEKRAEWPTHGIDPHQLTWDATRPGSLIVANGGVPTRPETGRVKRNLERMDSSLVRLDADTGSLLGQWRLDDPRLSLRHLAWNGRRLGVALQAEHDDLAAKTRAPVLAVFDGQSLRAVAAPRPLAGYGGDVAAIGDGFAVSCPRAQGVAIYGADGAWENWVALADACPLAAARDRLWAGGRAQVLGVHAAALAAEAAQSALQIDNHWIAV